MSQQRLVTSVLVTGGAGFIGSAVVRKLIHSGASVRAVVRPGGALDRLQEVRESIDIIEADITSDEALRRAMRGCNAVVHLAACKRNIHFHREHPAQVLDANVRMAASVFCAAQECNISRVLTLGSSRADSSWLASAHFGYAWGKRITEIFAEAYAMEYGMSTLTIRTENTFGPGDSFGPEGQVVPALIERVAKGERPLRIVADPHEKKGFSYVDDVACAVTELLGTRIKGIVRLTPSFSVSFQDLGTAIARAFGDCEVTFEQPSVARSERGVATETIPLHRVVASKSFEEAVIETVAWYRDHVTTA